MVVGLKGQEIRDYQPKPVAATLIVAASDSLHPERADYLCDGVNDHVEIQAALDALPATGGRVILLDGTYYIEATITLDSYQVLEGQGHNTILTTLSSPLALLISAVGAAIAHLYNIEIKNLKIDCDLGGGNFTDVILFEYVESPVVSGCFIRDHLPVGWGTAIELDDCFYSNISYNTFINNLGDADIYVDDTSYTLITGNITNGSQSLVKAYDGYGLIVNQNIILDTDDYGIYSEVPESVIDGNYINDTFATGIEVAPSGAVVISNNILINCGHGTTQSAISVFCYATVTGNFIEDATKEGIYVGEDYCVVTGNKIKTCGQHGISVSGNDCIISGNHCDNNSQTTSSTYHGINLRSGADRCIVSNNLCMDDGTDQEDGIHLEDGAIECIITGNYCYNNMGSGIALMANNDNCVIKNNLCKANDDYGIEIVAATCDKNMISGNELIDNVTGQLSDAGTLSHVEDNNIGIEITQIKHFRRVKNTSGGALAEGDVVILKAVAAGNEITTTINQGDDSVYGMVAEAIADTAYGLVQVKGFTDALKVNGTVAIAIGDILGTYTAAGITMKAAAGDQGFARALEAYAVADSLGVIDAYIKSPWD